MANNKKDVNYHPMLHFLNMQENIWKWHSSGSIFNYTNWYTGEPNNAGGDQDCLKMWSKAIHNYKWDDDDCSDKFRTICQIKGNIY